MGLRVSKAWREPILRLLFRSVKVDLARLEGLIRSLQLHDKLSLQPEGSAWRFVQRIEILDHKECLDQPLVAASGVSLHMSIRSSLNSFCPRGRFCNILCCSQTRQISLPINEILDSHWSRRPDFAVTPEIDILHVTWEPNSRNNQLDPLLNENHLEGRGIVPPWLQGVKKLVVSQPRPPWNVLETAMARSIAPKTIDQDVTQMMLSLAWLSDLTEVEFRNLDCLWCDKYEIALLALAQRYRLEQDLQSLQSRLILAARYEVRQTRHTRWNGSFLQITDESMGKLAVIERSGLGPKCRLVGTDECMDSTDFQAEVTEGSFAQFDVWRQARDGKLELTRIWS